MRLWLAVSSSPFEIMEWPINVITKPAVDCQLNRGIRGVSVSVFESGFLSGKSRKPFAGEASSALSSPSPLETNWSQDLTEGLKIRRQSEIRSAER